MAKPTLFRTLIDAPWWVSVLAAAVTYGVGVMVSRLLPGDANPHVLGVAAALPFIGIALYTMWLRIRQGPALDPAPLLKALRGASPEEMRAMLAERYQRLGYQIADGPGGDLELEQNGYRTLVRYRRWRAQSTGPAAVQELHEAMATRNADRGVYITAGTVTESARSRAGQGEITLVDGASLAELVRRTRGARGVVRRAAAEENA
jgi:hypothetical protein